MEIADRDYHRELWQKNPKILELAWADPETMMPCLEKLAGKELDLALLVVYASPDPANEYDHFLQHALNDDELDPDIKARVGMLALVKYECHLGLPWLVWGKVSGLFGRSIWGTLGTDIDVDKLDVSSTAWVGAACQLQVPAQMESAVKEEACRVVNKLPEPLLQLTKDRVEQEFESCPPAESLRKQRCQEVLKAIEKRMATITVEG